MTARALKRDIVVAVDMDSTVYDLLTPWMAYIHDVLGEDVSEGWKMWDVDKRFPKSGKKVFDFLEIEGMFYGLKLLPGAQKAIEEVDRMGIKQVFVSWCTTRTGPYEKQQAIKRDFPRLAGNVIITSGLKDAVKADILVDDGPKFLQTFDGVTIKIPYDYNEVIVSDFTMHRWSEYPALIDGITRYLK